MQTGPRTQPCLVLLFDIPPRIDGGGIFAMQTLVRWYAGFWYRDTGTQVLWHKGPHEFHSRLPDLENFAHDAVAQHLWQFVPLRIRYDGLNFDHAKLSSEDLKAHWLSALGQVTVEQ
jgi:hypothetical protein